MQERALERDAVRQREVTNDVKRKEASHGA